MKYPFGIGFECLGATVHVVLDVFLQHAQCHRLDDVVAVFRELFLVHRMDERFGLLTFQSIILVAKIWLIIVSYPVTLDHSFDSELQQAA